MSIKRLAFLLALIFTAVLCISGCSSVTAPPAAAVSPEPPVSELSSSPEPEPEITPEPFDGITVNSIDAFLEALGSDTSIRLEPGEYKLSDASNYGGAGSPAYRWEQCYDGYSLVLNDVSNLYIEGSTETKIITDPRYAVSLTLDNCENITLKSLTIGHTETLGDCSGEVIRLYFSRNITVESCNIFGCGTYGITMDLSKDVNVSDCVIHDCSMGAVWSHSSRRIVFNHCSFENNGRTSPSDSIILFHLIYSDDFSIVNSSITKNTVSTLFNTLQTSDLYIGGCRIESNRSEKAVFSIAGFAPVIDNCSFYLNTLQRWYSSSTDILAQTPDGEQIIYGSTFTNMPITEVEIPDYTVSGIEEPVYDNAIPVSNAEEFINAIGSNRIIVMKPGKYDLAELRDKMPSGDHFSWDECFDGYEFVIQDVTNLSIIGSGKDSVTILATPRYANVLNFDFCSNISISGITVGHTPEGYCTGGVIDLSNCENVEISDCGMFGCGTYGVLGENCVNITVKDSEIYHCTYGAVCFSHVSNCAFENVTIRDCALPSFSLTDVSKVMFNSNELTNGQWTVSSTGNISQYMY